MAGSKCPKTGFTVLSPPEIGKSLARKLVLVADRIRDLHTAFGGRPYKLRIIRTKWSSGFRGRGVEEITFERDILPTPLISDLSSLGEILQPVGLDEVGTIQVSEISGRFTEDQLLGFDDEGNGPDKDEQVLYEVEFPLQNGGSIKRRFFVRAAPTYSAYGFQWRVTLEKAEANRDRGTGDLVQ